MANNKRNKTSNSKNRQRQSVWIVLFIGLLVVLGGLGFVWQRNQAGQIINQTVSVQNVSVNDLANASGEFIVLDVREQWEYDEGHVAGVTLIPLAELKARASELPNDKAIYVICRSGQRSTRASTILKDAGKQDIRNVQGGTLAWVRAGLPLEQ